MVIPPARFIAAMPSAPSRFEPLRITPMAVEPKIAATEVNIKSMEGRENRIRRECASWIRS